MATSCWSAVWVLLAAAAVLIAPRADGAEGSAPLAALNDKDAVAAVGAFDAAFAAAKPEDRVRLVKGLAQHRHPKITDRLHDTAEDGGVGGDARAACLEALRARGKDEKPVGPRVGRWLAGAAEAAAKALRKGDIGVPVDPRTGDVDARSAATKAAVTEGASAARTTSAAIRCAVDLGWRPKEEAETMAPFLQSAYDDLVITALDTLGTWKETKSLPDVLQLFRMYPNEKRWETGAVVHAGGTNASAKAAWNTAFGHPLKQRARPAVVRAIRRSLESVTGRTFETPDALEAYLGDKKNRSAQQRR